MIPLKQTKGHKPPEQNGNCFATCVAAILELPIEAIPCFEDCIGTEWWPAIKVFANTLGYEAIYTGINDLDGNETRISPDQLKLIDFAPKGYSVLTGKSPRGDWDHCVVAFDGAPVYDVSPRPGALVDYVDWIHFEPLPEVMA